MSSWDNSSIQAFNKVCNALTEGPITAAVKQLIFNGGNRTGYTLIALYSQFRLAFCLFWHVLFVLHVGVIE